MAERTFFKVHSATGITAHSQDLRIQRREGFLCAANYRFVKTQSVLSFFSVVSKPSLAEVLRIVTSSIFIGFTLSSADCLNSGL